jgi:hypothetical protein
MDMLDWLLSALRGDFGGKGLSHYLSVLYNKRVGGGFV